MYILAFASTGNRQRIFYAVYTVIVNCLLIKLFKYVSFVFRNSHQKTPFYYHTAASLIYNNRSQFANWCFAFTIKLEMETIASMKTVRFQ